MRMHRTESIPCDADKGARLKKALFHLSIMVALLAGYAVFAAVTGFGFECPIKAHTGLLCPSCGMTRALADMVRLDLAGAWHHNPLSLTLLPAAGFCVLAFAARYVYTGKTDLSLPFKAAAVVIIAATALFGILRNII